MCPRKIYCQVTGLGPGGDALSFRKDDEDSNGPVYEAASRV
jgi:hypothetical protein